MPLVFAVLGGLVLLLFLLHAFWLWVACKVFDVKPPTPAEAAGPPRARGIRFRRALAIAVVALVGSWLVGACALALAGNKPSGLSLLGSAALFGLLLPFVCIRVGLSTGWGRTLLIGLLWQVFGALTGLGLPVATGLTLVQLFVIPTGPMAETLLGPHKKVTCPQCGLEFTVDASLEAMPVRPDGRAFRVRGCTCPNCRATVLLTRPEDGPEEAPRAEDGGLATALPDPGLSGGDRFAVAAGPLGSRLLPPARLDLITFTYPPSTIEEEGSKGLLRHIHRIVGLPGETVAIHRGKVYVLPPDQSPAYDDKPGEGPDDQHLWQKPFAHPNDAKAEDLWKAGKFEIVRKSPEQVLAMRRLVYDNDHPARDLTGEKWQRWKPAEGAGWAPAEPHGFRSDPEGEDVRWLRYRHVLRDRLPAGDEEEADKEGRQLITDFMGFNAGSERRGDPLHVGVNWASDLVLECEAVVEGEETGQLVLEVAKGADRFRAVFDLATGECALKRLAKGKAEEDLGSADAGVRGKGTYRLRLANVDDRLTVWVNDRLPFGDGTPYKGARGAAPTRENDLERPASIGVKGAKVTVRKIKLFRDTYYTCKGSEPDVFFDPRKSDAFEKLAGPEVPVTTFYVQPGHYFVLGDNSAQSADSRSWGVVPERLVLGKAFFVYFPLRRAGPLR